MNTKRTLVTLISASLLTVTAVPFALADGPGSATEQATDRAIHPTAATTADQNANPVSERRIAQVADRTPAPMNDSDEPDSDLKQASDKATGAVTDTWVQGKLEASFMADDHLSSFAIDTEVKNGVATLTGDVETKADIDRATKVAMSIKGITKVKNSLVVDSGKSHSSDPMHKSTKAPMRSSDMNHADMSDMDHADMDDDMDDSDMDDEDSDMERTADNAADAVSDTWIQGKLEASFMADDHLSSFAIDTEVKDGVATLTGTVETKADIDRATKVAKSIKGITKVNNSLVVEPAKGMNKS